MAAPNTDTIYNDIDAEILVPANLSAPKSGAASLRRAYKKVADWVKKSIIEASTWRKFDSSGSVQETDEVYRSGRTVIGDSQRDPAGPLFQVNSTPSSQGIMASFHNPAQPGSNTSGSFIRVSQRDVGFWDIGVDKTTSTLIIKGWNGSALVERARITADGRLLVGSTVANDRDLFQLAGSLIAKFNTQAYNPTTGELPNGFYRLVKNTATGELRIWANDGGTMKSILFQ